MLRNLIVVITLIIVALLPFVTKEHDADIPTAIWIVKDLPYLESENKAHKLDVYVSRNKNKKHPVVVWIHGGGWSTGSKADTPALELVSRGYATVSIDYRLSDDSIFPAQIHDSKAAVRWVRAHGTEYGFDTNKIAVWGISAGGHLAALLGTSQAVDALNEKSESTESANVDAVVDWCGPADLNTFDEQAKEERFRRYQPEQFVKSFLGGTPEMKSDLAREASPITYIEKGKVYPPFLIMHSEGDPIVPFAQSEELAAKLTQVGASVQFVKVQGAEHVPFNAENLKVCYEFLDKYMK